MATSQYGRRRETRDETMMQVADSDTLRKTWGNKVCEHREVEREFYLETPTGQFVCAACGKTFWSGDEGRMSHGVKT